MRGKEINKPMLEICCGSFSDVETAYENGADRVELNSALYMGGLTPTLANLIYAKEKCKKCFAKFYCSGGCAANSYNFHGNINDAYDVGCELQRKRIECAIMIKAAMAEMEEEQNEEK